MSEMVGFTRQVTRRRAVALLAGGMTALSGTALAGGITLPGNFGFNVDVTSIRENRFRGIVPQQYDFSCGSASVATLLTYHYGTPTTEQEVFDSMIANGDPELIQTAGFSLLDMKNYLERQGFRSDGFETSLDQLIEVGVPVIVIMNLQGYLHFVVVKGVTEDEVLVGDPALGLQIYAREDFEGMWNGILFAITDQMDEARSRFNLPDEWRLRASAPLGTAMNSYQLSSMSLMLPRPGDF